MSRVFLFTHIVLAFNLRQGSVLTLDFLVREYLCISAFLFSPMKALEDEPPLPCSTDK